MEGIIKSIFLENELDVLILVYIDRIGFYQFPGVNIRLSIHRFSDNPEFHIGTVPIGIRYLDAIGFGGRRNPDMVDISILGFYMSTA